MQIVSLTRPQKITALAIFIGVVAMTVFVLAVGPRTTARTAAPVPSTVNIPAVTVALAAVENSVAATSSSAARPSAKRGIEQSVDAWSLGSAKSDAPQIALNPVIRDYEVVEINQPVVATPKVGDTFSLPMLNGKKILVDVQTTSLNPNGDKSWSGHLQGYDSDYPVIMTYGERLIFATITTPEGSYTMESSDGVGWLYKNPSEFELSDTGHNDFLETPHSL